MWIKHQTHVVKALAPRAPGDLPIRKCYICSLYFEGTHSKPTGHWWDKSCVEWAARMKRVD